MSACGAVPGRTRLRLALAALAVLVAAADTYVVVLALPDLLEGVGVALDELQRGAPVVTGFLLGYVAVLPLAGRVSDVAGRGPVLMACLLLLAAGSLVTASAPDLGTAVAGRAVQGLGAGGLVPPTLALVADAWPPSRRAGPLGVVGAAQEAGSVAGPLLGAGVLALAGWRAIFWVTLAAAVVLAAALVLVQRDRDGAADDGFGVGPDDPVGAVPRGARMPRAGHLVAMGASVAAAVALAWALRPPEWLASSVALGELVLPLADGAPWSSPAALAAAALALLAVALSPLRAAARALRAVDVVGAALLAAALAAVVATFAGAEVSRSPVDARWPWLLAGGALALGAFALRQRRAAHPLVPASAVRARGAWGSLAVNAFVGAALVAVLVNVPIFARVTRFPDSQAAAALVLVQFLAALPAGALAGGWLAQRVAPRAVAAGGMALAAAALVAMSGWDAGTLVSPASTAALVVAGLGFGLAVAPVGTVVLAVTPPPVHGLASALAVLARTVGMLVGLSALTAIGLRVFHERQAAIGSPADLCPDSPVDCPAYAEATLASLVAEQQAIFLGAAACAAAAAVLAAVLLGLPGESDGQRRAGEDAGGRRDAGVPTVVGP